MLPGIIAEVTFGRSVVPPIPDGAWCVIRNPGEEGCSGRIALLMHRDIHDLESKLMGGQESPIEKVAVC